MAICNVTEVAFVCLLVCLKSVGFNKQQMNFHLMLFGHTAVSLLYSAYATLVRYSGETFLYITHANQWERMIT